MPSQSLRDAICEAADKVTAEAVTTRMIEEIRKAAGNKEREADRQGRPCYQGSGIGEG